MSILRKMFKDKDKKTLINVITALVIGILLIIMSNTIFKHTNDNTKKDLQNIQQDNPEKVESNEESYEIKLEKRLESALSTVEGVGNVKVMITLKNGREIIVAEDSSIDKSDTVEEDKSGGKRTINSLKKDDKAVLKSGNEPIILKELQPKIEGVIIIAEGGNSVEIKNSLIKATQALLNVEAHKIEVLKMK